MRLPSRKSVSKLTVLTVCAIASYAVNSHAVTQQWVPAGVDTNWSNTLNWSSNGSPAGNDLIFTNVSATAVVTNVVDANFTISSLTVLSNSYTTRLPAKLTVNGLAGLTLGDTNGSGNGTIIFMNGGGLVVNNANANFIVGPGNPNSITITADLSSLSNMTVTVSNFVVGGAVGVTAGRNSGGLLKCPTNTSITASLLDIGDSRPVGTSGTLNGGGGGNLSLSRVGPNVVNVDTIYVGRCKASGTLQFNTVGSGGSLTLRNKAGTGRVGTSEVGNRTEANSNSSQTGTVNLDNCIVDAQFGTLNIAHNLAGAPGGNTACNGTFTLGAAALAGSLVSVNTLNLTKSDVSIPVGGANVETMNGTLNVNSGTLAATNLNLGQISGTLSSPNVMNATVNVGGGTLLFGNTLAPSAGTSVTNNFQFGTIASVDGAARSLTASRINLGKIGTNATLNFGQASGGTGALSFGGAASLQTNVTLQTVQNTTFAGVIDGAFFFVKTGAANLILNGINTYTGPTTNLAGTLFGVSGGSVVGTVTMAPTTGNSAGLGVVVTNSTMSWTNSGVVFQAGGTGTILNFNYGATPLSTTVPAMQVNGNVDFTATPTVIVQAVTLANGSYKLMSWTGSQSGTAPTSVSLPPRVVANLSVSGNTLYLNVTGYSGPVRWASGNGTWDINNSGNNVWVNNGSSPTEYQEQFGSGDAVMLDDTATNGTPILILNTTATPNALTVSSTKSYSVIGSGKIAGTFALTKSGSGSLTLGSANSYSGGTTLTAGQLNINNGGSGTTSSAIGTGAWTINGGTFDNTSGSDVTMLPAIAQNWNADITYLGGANSLNLGSGAVTVSSGTTNLNVTVGANTLGIGGTLGPSTNYSVTKLGYGIFSLGGVNSLSGPVNILNGAVQLAGGSNLLNTASAVLLGNTNTTGKLILGSASGIANQALTSLTVSTNCPLLGNRVVGGNVAVSTLTITNAGTAPQNFNDSLGGQGANENNLAVTKQSSGGFGLGGTNTYTGVTRILQGLLDFRIKAAMYNGDTNNWTTTNIIVSSGAVLGFGIGGTGYFSPTDVEFFKNFGTTNGGLQNGAILGLDPVGGDYTYGGVITDITTPSATTNVIGLTAINTNAVTITATNTYTGGTYAGFFGTLRVAGQGALQQNKILTLGAFGGPGTLQYDSAAESTFSDANFGNGTLASGTLNQTAGTVNITGTMKLGQGNSSSYFGTVNLSGGNLNVNTLFNGYAAIAPNNITVSGTANLVVSNGYSVGSVAGSRNSTGLLTQNGGSITIAGGMMLARYDATRIRISTNNLNGGTLNADYITAEATDGSFPTTNIAVMNFNGGTLKATTGGTLVSGLTSVNVKTNGAILDDGGNSVSIGQPLVDDGTQVGGLTKLGAGTVMLTGDSTYYGASLINNGTLAISGGSISNSIAFDIASGAIFDVSGAPGFVVQPAQTLKGNGTVNGSVTVNGTLAPGTSVGTLTFNNDLAVNGNLVFELNKSLAPSNDLAFVTGTLTTSGTGTLTVNNLGPALVMGDKFTLFNQPLPGGNAITIVPPNGVTFTNTLEVDGSIQVLTATSAAASYPTNITTRVSGRTLTISWPATHLGWILQSQTNPLIVGLATNWVDIVGTTSVTSTNLTINPAMPTAFFRLRHP